MQDLLTDKKILTVSELNRSVKRLLENHYQVLWIEGEVSNLSRPQSGHIYFTLKDEQAQVRCAMFRLRNFSLPFELENGMHILAMAKISLYEGRGDYQLIIEHLEDRGEGLLRRRFELLKKKLAEEGLFDLAHKRCLPHFPKKIGVITSPTGAAIKDVLSVLQRRFANIPVIIYPTSVQGEQAAQQIALAIKTANDRNECDVIIICRGGGSLEDLFAFNEEIVARAIFQSNLPTVSGIGHEVDFTIADFVADHRAPTPSAAAELLSPDKKEYCQRITEITARLAHFISSELRHKKMLVENFRTRCIHPRQLLMQYSQTIDILAENLHRLCLGKLDSENRKLQILLMKLQHLNPSQQLKEKTLQIKNKFLILTHAISRTISESKQHLSAISRALNTVSPLNTLERGYSIATKDGHVIENIVDVKSGDHVRVEIKTGYLFCTIDECKKK